jgi:hypothetical protein
MALGTVGSSPSLPWLRHALLPKVLAELRDSVLMSE